MWGRFRRHWTETTSQYITADRPETTAVFPASQEVDVGSNLNFSSRNPVPSKHHIKVKSAKCIFCFRWSWSCYFGLGHKNLVLCTSLVQTFRHTNTCDHSGKDLYGRCLSAVVIGVPMAAACRPGVNDALKEGLITWAFAHCKYLFPETSAICPQV